jgi:Ca-activated chloride channel family protein
MEVVRSVARGRFGSQRAVATALILGAVTAIVGVARPQVPYLQARDDTTVVMVLDASSSMSAADVPPTRMDAAKQAALTFVRGVPPTVRVGLVAFSDSADVMAWPTADRSTLGRAIEAVDPLGATAIGEGLMKALRVAGAVDRTGSALPRAAGPPATAVLLLSDGRNNAGTVEPAEAAAAAARAAVPVYTVALGTEDDAAGGSTGSVVAVDPVDRETLREVAERTEARAFAAPTAAQLRQVYEGLATRIGYERSTREVTSWFAIATAIILGGATVTAISRRPALP